MYTDSWKCTNICVYLIARIRSELKVLVKYHLWNDILNQWNLFIYFEDFKEKFWFQISLSILLDQIKYKLLIMSF